MFKQSLPWCDPLDLAARVHATGAEHWVLLYSGVRTDYSGRYSYLACDPAERIAGADFSALAPHLSTDQPPLANAWFGYLGYELNDCREALPPSHSNGLTLPPLCMMRFHRIYQFDHDTQTMTLWTNAPAPALPPSPILPPIPQIIALSSPMSRQAYLDKAASIIERIHAGDLYQANLTRKFTGQFSQPPDSFAVFRHLCAVSPAPYSAFLRLGEHSILSSSPELFLHIDANGHMRTRPIKGTAPRFTDLTRDAQSRESLASSPKDRAENLMIADLMRNDLSRSCLAGSIRAASLFDITSHATIHHMSSTVTGQKRPECSTLEAVRHCFPPGSMTGAPKIKAMQLCGEMEALPRGVYSGALGWFGGDGTCELSVVIRTLILQNDGFEFQVGGAIVADSTPEQELKEIIDKSVGILKILGLPADALNTL